MSICVAIIPPKSAMSAIEQAMGQYKKYLDAPAPSSTWHIPLAYPDDMPRTDPLRQAFHQTIQILSIGEGEEKGQLWVRIKSSPGLSSLQDSVLERTHQLPFGEERTDSFVPHITIGTFQTTPPFGIIDTPLTHTFSIREVHVIQTDPYEIITSIPLTP